MTLVWPFQSCCCQASSINLEYWPGSRSLNWPSEPIIIIEAATYIINFSTLESTWNIGQEVNLNVRTQSRGRQRFLVANSNSSNYSSLVELSFNELSFACLSSIFCNVCQSSFFTRLKSETRDKDSRQGKPQSVSQPNLQNKLHHRESYAGVEKWGLMGSFRRLVSGFRSLVISEAGLAGSASLSNMIWGGSL